MLKELKLLFCALQFLTRIPVPQFPDFDTEWTTRSAKYFPLVGALVGAICAAVLWGAHQLWTSPLPALLAVTAGIVITGAFHEDGLADAVDGLAGGRDAAHRLTIMKDSRIGTYGTLALVLCLALKTTAIASFPTPIGPRLLIAGHAGGRACAILVMSRLRYAADMQTSKVKPAPIGVTKWECLLALVFGLWPLLFLAPPIALAGLITGSIFGALIAIAAFWLVKGYTGDILGAVEQLFELGFFLAAAAAV